MDLEKAAFDYGFEVRMMVASLNALYGISPDGTPPKEETAAWAFNAALEGFLLHARVLIEFHVPTHSDDIRPTMFLQDAQPPDELSARLRKVKQRIDKRLVHLTGSRQKLQTGFAVFPIAVDLVTLIEGFVSEVARRYPEREAWFAHSIEACSVFREDYPQR